MDNPPQALRVGFICPGKAVSVAGSQPPASGAAPYVLSVIAASETMNKPADVLERSAIPAGKIFLKAGEENSRAYVIQAGLIISFMEINGRKVEVERHGPGTIIGELCLMVDAPIVLSYEALEPTTVVTITRQDFQKRLTRVDKTVVKILTHTVEKLAAHEKVEIEKAIKRSEIDDMAQALALSILKSRKLSVDQQIEYERMILPPINDMIKAIKKFKEETSA